MAKTKKEALAIVFAAADLYKTNMVDHSLLFLCMDKHKTTYGLEVTFDRSNFQHLTGLETNPGVISPAHFFQLCLDRRLKESEFSFSSNGTADWKLDALPLILKKNLSANMIGIYNRSQTLLATERLAGNISVCMGFVRDGKTGRYVPNTVLKGDIRNLVYSPDRIIVTYRKSSKDEKYSDIVYSAKKVDWDTVILPVDYAYLKLPSTPEHK